MSVELHTPSSAKVITTTILVRQRLISEQQPVRNNNQVFKIPKFIVIPIDDT